MYRVADITTVDPHLSKSSPVRIRNNISKWKAFDSVSPVVIIARTFGLQPCCLRTSPPTNRILREDESENSTVHCVLHYLLIGYSILVIGLCLVFSIGGLFYLLLDKEYSTNFQFTIFDVILVWQATFLSCHCLFIRNRMRLYLQAVDSYVVSQQHEKMNKVEPTATVIYFANHQNHHHTSLKETNELEPLNPETENLYKSSRKWCTILAVVSCIIVLSVIIQNIWSEMEDSTIDTPMIAISHWITTKGTSRRWAIFLGTIVNCVSLLYNILPQILFVGCAIPLLYLTQHFNTKASQFAVNCLDTDKVVALHYRLRHLVKLLDDCFSTVIFVTIAGDFCQLTSGTYLGLLNCSLQGMSSKCSRYFVRHVLLILRLCLVVGIGAALHEKIQGLLTTMEEYSSRSLLNTEKLKLLSLFQSLPTCGVTGSSFFLITRNFVSKMVAFVFIYGVVLWKISR